MDFLIFSHIRKFLGGRRGKCEAEMSRGNNRHMSVWGERKGAVLFFLLLSIFGVGVARSNEWKRWSCQKFGNPRAFVQKSKKSRFFAFIRPAIQSATENGFTSSPYFPHVMKNTFFPKTLLLAVLHLGNVFLLSRSGFKRWGGGGSYIAR